MGLSAGTIITKETKATNNRALLVVLLFGDIVSLVCLDTYRRNPDLTVVSEEH